MVYEQFDDNPSQSYGEIEFASGGSYGSTASRKLDDFVPAGGRRSKRNSMASIQVPAYQEQPAFMYDQEQRNDWASIAEATMPLRTSEFLKAASRQGGHNGGGGGGGDGSPQSNLFQASVEARSRDISRQLIWVNVISLFVNLTLAAVGFYFSFVNNSSSTSAFAADCVLDFISSAIVLWRYYGDLSSVYMHAREQIACIYLGALFEISALGIIIKASSDIATGASPEEGAAGYDLIYLSVAATMACTILTVFKCSLYKTIRDKSILLDVINTLISTIFAMSIIMSQLLINVDASFWYMDPILSIILAIFMAGFGLKVLSQNFHILRPCGHLGSSWTPFWPFANKKDKRGDQPAAYSTPLTFATNIDNNGNYQGNLQLSIDQNRAGVAATNWQKSDYSTISFI